MADNWAAIIMAEQHKPAHYQCHEVACALDADSDDEAQERNKNLDDVPNSVPQGSSKKPAKGMYMTSDLNSTPNGGREWETSLEGSSETSHFGDNVGDKQLDTDQGHQRKPSITERILVSRESLFVADLVAADTYISTRICYQGIDVKALYEP